jgi:pyruvate formate lyase activating enzyme
MNEAIHEARWWKSRTGTEIECELCPRHCVISDGAVGFCRVRRNRGGRLLSLSYAKPVSLQVDPIEKKPLAEFLSGTFTFSLGTYGCNLECKFCQNHLLSRNFYDETTDNEIVEPETIVEMAVRNECRSIAFTYNEPTVFAEYAVDIAVLAKERGLSTVLVSNGYIDPKAADEIYPLIDAANIDLKGFSEEFYREMTGARLQPVLDAIRQFHSIGGHLELTNLVIPGKNDDPAMIEALLEWVGRELGTETPLHFSAYHPAYRFHDSPRTPASTLLDIQKRAKSRGFEHVYVGNIGKGL